MKNPLLSRSALSPLTRSSLIACASLCAVASSALAAGLDQAWTGAADDLWTSPGNWNTAAPGSADIALFNASSVANLATKLGTDRSILGLTVTSPAGAVSITHRLAAVSVTANNLTDTLTYSVAPATPFTNGDIVTLAAATIPAGLTANTQYFVVGATATTFQVSTTSGGSAINFTADGATVTATGGPTLTLGASGINMSAATQNFSTVCPLVLGDAQTWNVAGSQTVTSSGGISGTGSINKTGSGGLILGNVSNPFSGGATVTAGTITLGSGSSGSPANLGAAGSNITLAGGTITNGTGGSNGSIGLNNNFIVNAESTINMGNRMALTGTVTGSATLNVNANTTVTRDDLANSWTGFTGTVKFYGSGGIRLVDNGGDFNPGSFANCTVDLGGSAAIRPRNFTNGGTYPIGKLTGSSATADLGTPDTGGTSTYSVGGLGQDSTFDGGIRGNSALTKTGAGTLTLTNTTTLDYTGVTTVDQGTLKLMGIKSGTGNTSVNGGILAGTGTSAGTTTIANGGTLAPGDNGIGNITFANLTLANGSTLSLQFGTGNDTATVQTGGTLTLAAGGIVDVNGFGTNGTYTIINTTGATVSGTASTALTAFNGVGGKTYIFSATPNAIQMTISSSDPNNFWNVDGAGSWNLAANWSKGLIPNASGAIAKIGPGPGGFGGFFTPLDFSIALNATRTVGTLGFDDMNSNITIESGTSGSLFFDNGASASVLSLLNGNHIISAPIAIDADDLSADIADTYALTVSGTVSGSGAALSKAGLGTLILSGSNTYDGGTTLTAGTIAINSATSLGNAAGALNFAGGTLRLDAPILTGVTRNYQVSGASNAQINTNGNDLVYEGVIGPVGGATGGLSKSGGGALTLSTAHTYTGATTLSGGGLNLNTGGVINGGATNISNGSNFTIAGGSLTASAASSVTGAAFNLNSGSATFSSSFNVNTGNPNANYNVNLTSGNFSAASITMGRGATIITNPATGSNTFGLYVNGATANITGALNLGTNGNNSSVSARIDSGSLTVDGTVLLQITSGDRWTVFDVNGGTFTSTEAVTGVQIGNGQVGSSAFLVRNGTATAERIVLTQAATSTETSRLNVTGGSLYVGTGGIVNTSTGTGVIEVLLGGGTLGAKANWSSSVAATLTGAATIKAADASGTAHDIALSGAVGGTGSLTKTGAGKLTLTAANTYTGNTTVSAGMLSTSTASLADTSTVDVSATGLATLELNFTGSDVVAGFSIDGVAQATGTWGSSTSTATHKTDRISGTGILNVGGTADPFTDWIDDFAVGGLTGKNDDPDHDGLTNIDEFALDGNPASGVATGKVRSRIETIGADKVLVITLPVRDGASFTGLTSKTATVDGVAYTIEGSNNLSLFDQGVTEIAVSAAGMPTPLTTGWSYHTFRLDGAIGGATPRGPKGFLRAKTGTP